MKISRTSTNYMIKKNKNYKTACQILVLNNRVGKKECGYVWLNGLCCTDLIKLLKYNSKDFHEIQ